MEQEGQQKLASFVHTYSSMKLSKDIIRHIANLAKLALSPEEEDVFSRQLGDVLGYMKILEEMDTDNVIGTNQVTGLRNIFREDEVKHCPESLKKKILREVPKMTGEYIAVPHSVQKSS